MDSTENLEQNKAAVIRFNKEVIEKGDEMAFQELIAQDFVNRTAAPETPAGAEGLIFTLNKLLRPAFPDLSPHFLFEL